MTAASPDQIRLHIASPPQTPRPTVVWEEERVDTGLSEEAIDNIRRQMRGKCIQVQKQLRQWFDSAPWRLGCVRAYHPFTPSELQYFKTHHGFWTMKRWKKLLGCLLETDNAKQRRSARRSKRQPTRSERDCFINIISRQQGILHTTRGGLTTAPGMEMANLLRDVGRQEVDTYDRGNRILWRLPNGHIVCTTKRALTSMQTEAKHHVNGALVACKSIIKSEMRARRKRGTPTQRTPRLRKRPRRSIKRMTTVDVVEMKNTVAMVAVNDKGGSTRRRAGRVPWAAMGVSLEAPQVTPATTFKLSAEAARSFKAKRPTGGRRAKPRRRQSPLLAEPEDDDSSSDEEGGAYWSSSSSDSSPDGESTERTE